MRSFYGQHVVDTIAGQSQLSLETAQAFLRKVELLVSTGHAEARCVCCPPVNFWLAICAARLQRLKKCCDCGPPSRQDRGASVTTPPLPPYRT